MVHRVIEANDSGWVTFVCDSVCLEKPYVGLLNVDGYYNSLLTFIDKAVDEGFISPMARRIIVSAPNAKELVRQLEEYEPEFDEITSKLVWDEVDRLSYVPGSEVTT
ncbi:hypothetical protein F2Q68_00007117 [Brassica cretica]|uniref:cytokinin riboside 5'-monophosphate phosphoribohydrolase n=1 Tax=Brassica cretica TaxID=69181 RepID=A0A8S9KZN9_BRACR|nr:hypothetical protein F2Q68_00007117 [Brassica cretica]